MELYRKQITRGRAQFLVLTDEDPKTHAMRGVVVDTQAKTVRRVPNIASRLRLEPWQSLAASDPTLDALVRLVPALRPFRGIEIRLPSGDTAWIRWRQWSSDSREALTLLAETTRAVTIPAYEPDGDYFLAAQAVAVLGGQVVDNPRAAASLGEAY